MINMYVQRCSIYVYIIWTDSVFLIFYYLIIACVCVCVCDLAAVCQGVLALMQLPQEHLLSDGGAENLLA